MTSSNLSPVNDPDKKENWLPASTRLRSSDRTLIKRAVLEIESQGRNGYTMSDFLRESALERAEAILNGAAA